MSKRVASPKKKKSKLVQNTFELIQFKKIIGKGLIVPFKGSTAIFDQSIKDKILSKTIKSIAMTGLVSSGIIHIFDGVDRLLAINAISYAEIKKASLDIDIIINQYTNMQMSDLAN